MNNRIYNKSGNWYIYEKNDINVIYDSFLSFYNDILKPFYGETDVCDFEYDKELQIIKLRKYGKGIRFFKKKKIIYLSKNKDISLRVHLMLDTFIAKGILISPLYKIRVSFGTNNTKDNSLLIERNGKGDYKDFSSLKGYL